MIIYGRLKIIIDLLEKGFSLIYIEKGSDELTHATMILNQPYIKYKIYV